MHSTGQTDRPNLGGAPCPFPTVGKAKPYPSIRSYPVQPTAFCGVIHSWIGETRSIHPVSGFISALMKVFMTISYANKAATIATSLIEAKQHDDKATSLRENVNKEIVGLHKDKVVVGRYNTCAIAMAFQDTLTTGGWAKKTAQNYLTLFRNAVETGQPVKDWGGTKAGGRKGGKTAKATTAKELADKLATAYRDADFEGFVNDLQASYENAEVETLLEGIQSYLEAAGIELK